MAAPSTTEEFLELVRKSGVADEKRLDSYLKELRAAGNMPPEPGKLAGLLIRDGILTHFQAEQFLLGKWRRFTIGKYKVLERLGSGGMGSVYLCEHKFMRRRVAVKVLPAAKAEDPSSLERFYREARAAAALDHANIVRAYDIDQDENLHFLVMEYVDGASLQEIVKKHGPMDIVRAAHYIRQAAIGLHHAHEAGLVHRDIKPGNLLVDRNGTVKVLDMGLARFFRDEEDILTKKYDENVLGTADYLAPEQALDSHGVDIRADIYSLGATFYFLLTGGPPFSEGTVAQKLIWHQTRQPKSIRALRPDVPEAVIAIVDRMMAKDLAQRYQTPLAVAEALTPWTEQPIPPPPEGEMPRLSLAALGENSQATSPRSTPVGLPATPRKISSGPAAGPVTPSSEERPEGRQGAPIRRGPESGQAGIAVAAPAIPSSSLIDGVGLASLTAPAKRPERQDSRMPWETLTDDTDDPSARADTTDVSAKAAATRSPLALDGLLAALRQHRSLWVLVASAAVAVLFAGAVLAWLAFHRSPPAATSPVDAKSHNIRLIVSPDNFRTLREAIAKATSENTTIEVRQEVLEERLDNLTDAKLAKGLTIIGAAPSGKPVEWRPPARSKDKAPLLQIISQKSVDGFSLKNFIFKGDNVVDDLVVLYGQCPGLSLENVQLEGFNRSAVKLLNCAGTERRPITLARLRAVTGKETEAALLFEISPRMKNSPDTDQHIRVSDCRFEGPYRSAVEFIGSVADVEFARNRFFQSADGFLYRTKRGPDRIIPQPGISVSLDSNMFAGLTGVAFHLGAVPRNDDNSRIVLKNNVFSKTGSLAQVDEFEPVPIDPKTSAKWIWFNEEKHDPLKEAPAQSRFFRKTFTVPSIPGRATLDIGGDDGFVAYLNGERIDQRDFSSHVYAFDVTKRLQPGNNVLAIEGKNAKGPAGILAQLTIVATATAPTKIVSDATWKASKTGPTGWEKPNFADAAWPAAKDLCVYGDAKAPPWQNLIWDSTIPDQLQAAAKPLLSTDGNVCDPACRQGNLVIDVKEVPVVPPAE